MWYRDHAPVIISFMVPIPKFPTFVLLMFSHWRDASRRLKRCFVVGTVAIYCTVEDSTGLNGCFSRD
jgi:hypothetical protein